MLESGFHPSHRVSIDVRPKYHGSLWNILVSFPGYLLFTHAWHGFVYRAELNTTVRATPLPAASREAVVLKRAEDRIATDLSMRHCDFDRGALQGLAWVLTISPPLLIIEQIFAGFVVTRYDSDVTHELHQEFGGTYGDYVGERIVRLLRDAGAERYASMRVRSGPIARRTAPLVGPTALWHPSQTAQAWLLAVGVSKHRSDVTPVPYAKRDVQRVTEWFTATAGLPETHVRVLWDEQCTRENLLREVDWLRRSAEPEDLIVFYYVGHGAPEVAEDGSSVDARYLTLYETIEDSLYATALPLRELRSRLDDVKAEHQLVILESCYTGEVGQRVLAKAPVETLRIVPQSLTLMATTPSGGRRRRAVLTASSGRQVALASEELQGGIFTHCLLQAWGDGRTCIMADCWANTVDQVRRMATSLGSTQVPQRLGDPNLDVQFGRTR